MAYVDESNAHRKLIVQDEGLRRHRPLPMLGKVMSGPRSGACGVSPMFWSHIVNYKLMNGPSLASDGNGIQLLESKPQKCTFANRAHTTGYKGSPQRASACLNHKLASLNALHICIAAFNGLWSET